MSSLRLVALLAALGLPAVAWGGGFSVTEVGSRESARGSAATALADSPSAIYFNPANIATQDGLRLQLGMSALLPKWEYRSLDGSTTTKSEDALSTPPHFAASYNLGQLGQGPLAVGVGVFVPYGSTFAWPEDWAGRGEIQKISLQVFEVSPAVAWKPHPRVAVGASFRYLPSSVYLKKAVRFGTEQEGDVEIAGSGSGIGAGLGISFFPVDGLTLAFAWRSGVTLDMEGQSNFRFEPPFDTEAVDRDVRTSVSLPNHLRLGFDYRPVKDLSITADVEYQFWSSFKSMDIIFINADGTEEVQSSPRNSHDTFVIHVGAEYRLHEYFALRAGYVYDQTILDEETVNPAPPESDKHVVAVGASLYLGRFGVHANFSNVFFAKRTSTTAPFPGEWRGGHANGTMAYIFGLSLSAQLDAPTVFGSPAAAQPALTPVAQ